MDKKCTRSNRLRKIENIYNKYKNLFEEKPKEKDNHQNKSIKTKKPKPLNSYQKFVKYESKKEMYKNMNVEDRFSTIGKVWNNKKKIILKHSVLKFNLVNNLSTMIQTMTVSFGTTVVFNWTCTASTESRNILS